MPYLPKRKKRKWEPEPKERKLYKTWQSKEENRLYSSRKWRNLRKQVLTEEPLCRQCKKNGRITEATVVDHIHSVRLGGKFFDRNNLQPLCMSCHNSKSGKEGHEVKKY